MLTSFRLPPCLWAGLSVVAGLLLIDRLITLGLGTARAARFPTDYERLEEAGSNLSALERRISEAKIPASNRVAICGFSTAITDVDAEILRQTDSEHRDWIALGIMGTRISSMNLLVDMLMASNVPTETIVLAIGPGHFSRHSHERIFTESPFDGPRGALRKQSWLLSFRERGVAPHKEATMKARLALARSIDAGMASIFAPSDNPYAMSNSVKGRPLKAPVPYDQKPFFKQFCEALDPSQIVPLIEGVNPQATVFRKIAETLRSKGRLVVCLMPENRWMRQLNDDPAFLLQLRALLPAGAVLVDLRSWGSEELFYDPMHLNSTGRERFSREFPALLSEALKTSPHD